MAEPAQPRHQRGRHHGRRELALARQQRRAALVALADDGGTLRRIHIVENAQQLVFDEAALLLDHQHVLQAFGEAPRAALFQRPGQRDLVDAQAHLPRLGVADAEIGQRLAQIEIGLAGGDDAEPRRLAVEHDAIEALARANAATASIFGPCSRRSCSSGGIGPADVEARPAASRNRPAT